MAQDESPTVVPQFEEDCLMGLGFFPKELLSFQDELLTPTSGAVRRNPILLETMNRARSSLILQLAQSLMLLSIFHAQ